MARPDPHPLADPRLFGKQVGSSCSFRSLAGDAGDLAQRTMVKASAFPDPESRQRKNPNPPRVLLEGGGGLGFIRHDYCYISGHQCLYRVAHSVLEHRLGARSVATFITKRACLLRSQRSVRSFGGRRLWRGPSAAEVASLGWLLGASWLRC